MYDRNFLLSPEKRNQVLELWEVQKYGADSFSDPDYLCIYGLKPAEWFARGIRLLARTAVECTRDSLADLIGRDIAAVALAKDSAAGSVIIDPFAGSGNTMYWIQRHMLGAKGIGFELDDAVFANTTSNIALVGADIEIVHADYESAVKRLAIAPETLIVVFVAPPWGDALRQDTGLDLRRTQPAVSEIVDLMRSSFDRNKIIFAIQIYEFLDQDSLHELKSTFDWSSLNVYDIDAPGKNHGILLGAKGWSV